MIELYNNTFFLDTNILLDYIEERNKDVKNALDVLINLAIKDELVISTSILNIAELLDNELDINYYSHCKYKIKMPDNEIKSKKGDTNFYKSIAKINRQYIEEKIKQFIEESNLRIFLDSSDDEMLELFNLLCDNCLQSQDAVIVSTALFNEADYLLTNDRRLIDSLGTEIYLFDLSVEKERERFRRELKSLGYEIE